MASRGTIRKINGVYYLRIYVGKKRRELSLGSVHELQSKKDIERAADNVRLRLGVAGTGARVTLERFAEHWFLRVAYGRYHLPTAFGAVESEWRGWHAFRRGLASTLFETGAEDLVVQRILRHARVIVTRESYIKRFDIRVTEAMGRIGVPKTEVGG